MVFKELEIQGFKSFPDKVRIRFDEGVTGVVGPNGSGKSNLSDAVRWVLGETSSRQLRAAGKMEDVIFGGTRRRGAMGFAMVRLTLDNSAHTLDIDADEAVIGRKYYRSGESEYTINGQVCRLKDIYELLLDTGIGRDGYSVIGQGRIAEIVAAKSSERREIFEEACGIAKYRYRRNEAERRLAAAAENLERLRDILGELEARVGPLEKESEKAQRFLELSARRKTLEVTLWTDGVHRAREAVRRQVRDYETAQAEYERFDREARAAEAEAEKIRMQAQQLTIAVERLNGDIRSITEELSGSDSRIAVLENDIARNEESAAALQADIAAGEQDSTEAAAALERHRAVARSMAAAGEKLAAELAELDAELLRLTSENNASGARRDTLRAEVADLTAKRTEAQVAKAAAEAARTAAAAAETACAAHSLMAELVVPRPLVGVAQHVVSLGSLLEFLLGAFVPRILIRVILQRRLPVSLLDLVGTGSALYFEHLVVISFRHNRLFSYNNFSKTNHFIFQFVAFLDYVDDLSLLLVGNRELGDRFVQGGIQFLADRRDLLDTLRVQGFEQFLMDQHDPLADRIDIARFRHRVERPVDIVHHGQQRFDHVFAARGDQIHFFPQRPFAVIVELGHQPQVFVLPLALGRCHPCRFVIFFGRLVCHLVTRLLLDHLLSRFGNLFTVVLNRLCINYFFFHFVLCHRVCF